MSNAAYIRRFFALIFDIFISISLFCGIILIVQSYGLEFPIKEFFAADQTAMLHVYLYCAGFYLFYDLLFSALLSATPGKIVVNIEDEYYRGHTLINVLLRSVFKTITVFLGPVTILISFVVALFSKDNQSIHDYIARTTVKDETRSPRLFGAFIMIASIALFIYFYFKNLTDVVFDFRSVRIPQLYE
ncbi:MAG: RDD family protein [Clostridiales bacterium]|nr:RDD family protein [Clostridiales bacterium]